MPKTATPRKPETVSRKLAETRNTSKNRSLSSLLGIGDNEKRLATDLGSGLNDVIGRGTIAGLLGLPGDLGGAAENGLRSLLGLPQVVPYGGSEHIGQKMEQAGLVSSVRRPKTELLASLISPAQAATAGYKAPQMARAGVQMMDNLASAPTMARMGQRGAIDVWHGSPHKLEQFNAMDNIGNGQGGGSFGVGGYHASDVGVAKEYVPDGGYLYENQLRWPDPAKEAKDPLSDRHFLDWDKPFDEQSDYVKSVIQGMNDDDWYRVLDNLGEDGDWSTGRNIYDMARLQFDSKEEASRRLAGVGIPGIRFNDSDTIHRLGTNTPNYVTFDDSLVNIVSRNGQPVGNLGKMVAPQDEALRVAQANAAKPVSEGGLGLRPDNTPEERAAAMGFDIENPMAHGTDKNIKKFKVGKSGYDEIGSGVYTAPIAQPPYGYTRSNAWAQGEGGINYPLVVKNDLADYDAVKGALQYPIHRYPNGDAVSPPTEVEAGLIQRIVANDPSWAGNEDLLRDQIRIMGDEGAIRKAGYAGARSKDSQVPNQVVTFDPRNIRSRFAAFDPMRRDSSDLLAGLAPFGAIPWLWDEEP